MINRRVKYLLIPLLFFALSASILSIQWRIDELRGGYAQAEEFMYLPSGKYLKPAVLGYDQLAADLLWLQAVQYVGGKEQSVRGYKWLYHILDIVTTLDPKFDYAYQSGGVILSVYAHRIEESNELLKKGYRENPGVWQIPFYLGFNHFFYLDDYQTAASYITRASLLPGRPAYLPKLAARLYAQAGTPELAIEFLHRIYQSTADERLREELQIRIKEVIVERDINLLEAALSRYKLITGKGARDLRDIVDKGILKSIPQEPFGGDYFLDSKTNEVKSSSRRKRLRIHGKRES